MKWIKASERLPEKDGQYFTKSVEGWGVSHFIKDSPDGNGLEPDEIWLDESEPASQPSAPTEAASDVDEKEIYEVVKKIFYSPATNNKATGSILDGVDAVKALLAKSIKVPTPSTLEKELVQGYAKQLLKDISQGFLSPINQQKAHFERDKEVFQGVGETIENFPLPDYDSYLSAHASTPPTATPEAAKEQGEISATDDFKLYLNSIINTIPKDIHNMLWEKLIQVISTTALPASTALNDERAKGFAVWVGTQNLRYDNDYYWESGIEKFTTAALYEHYLATLPTPPKK